MSERYRLHWPAVVGVLLFLAGLALVAALARYNWPQALMGWSALIGGLTIVHLTRTKP